MVRSEQWAGVCHEWLTYIWFVASGAALCGCTPGGSPDAQVAKQTAQRQSVEQISRVILGSPVEHLVVGQVVALTPRVELADGQVLDNVSGEVDWIVSDPSRLEAVPDRPGQFLAHAPGPVAVRAAYGGVRSEAVRLMHDPLVRRAVEPAADEPRSPVSLLSSDGRFDDGSRGEWRTWSTNGRVDWNSGTARYHVEVSGEGHDAWLSHALPIESGATYTLCFDGRASRPRPIGYRIEGLPPRYVSFVSVDRGVVELINEWQHFQIELHAIASDPSARLVFYLGEHAATYELDNIGVYPGTGCGNPKGTPSVPLAGRTYPLNARGIEPLTVRGSHVLKGGQKASLSGVSLFWSTATWKQHDLYNASVVGELKRHWNASIIRIPMAVEAPGGYLERPAENRRRVERIVRAALKNDMYVIIDWHSHEAHLHEPGQWPAATEFFTGMARLFGKHPNVIYEIYNEPHTDDWQAIRPYAQHVVDAIRAVDPDNLIIAPTPLTATLPHVACADPIDGQNIAYSLHFYAGSHGARLRAAADRAMEAGCAIFVSEYGLSAANGDGAPDPTSHALWVAWLETHGISHAAWALSRKREGASLLDHDASPVGGWRYHDDHTLSDLSEAGVIVRAAMLTWNGGRVGDGDEPGDIGTGLETGPPGDDGW